MSFGKKLLKDKRTEAALSWFLASYIRLVYYTSRKVRHVDSAAMPYMLGNENAIFAFWHGRMMLLPAFCPPNRKMRVLISLHRDGMLISRVIGRFNQATVSGSTSRGGKEALNESLRSLESGDNISITPDGPRGPAQIATKGTVTMAKISKRPILPVTFASTRAKRFSSWDRFMLALPFGRIMFYVGAPIFVRDNLDETGEEAARLEVEQAMNALVLQADGAVGGQSV